jgi:hypothetical protein
MSQQYSWYRKDDGTEQDLEGLKEKKSHETKWVKGALESATFLSRHFLAICNYK